MQPFTLARSRDSPQLGQVVASPVPADADAAAEPAGFSVGPGGTGLVIVEDVASLKQWACDQFSAGKVQTTPVDGTATFAAQMMPFSTSRR